MSYLMYIFCPKLSQISRREIATFAKEGIFVEDLVFQPSPEDLVAEIQNWLVFEIWYSSNKQPIVFTRLVEHQEIQDVVDEAIEVIHQWRWRGSNDVEHLIKTVRESHEVIEIKINRLELSEDEYAWAMVDCIEAYFARESNGIVYATDDAFYDRNLQLILKTSKN